MPDADSVFHTLLAKIPDHDDSLELLLATSFERAAEIFDVPDRTTDPENWYRALSFDPDGPLTRSLVISGRNMDQWRAGVGFSAYDELGEAVVQYRDVNLSLHLVDVDAAAIDRAVRTEPAWSDVLIDAEVAGLPYYTWGEVDLSIATQTATHDWVEGGYMAISDHVVLRTMNEDAFVDALTGANGQSLADNPDVALIVDSFAERQVYSMALTKKTPVVLGAVTPDRLLVLPYRLLGTGQAFEGNQRQAVLAYVHDDQDSAIENAARLDAILTDEIGRENVPYADMFGSFHVSVDGVLVSVVLNLDVGSGFWIESLLRDEPLYWADGRTSSSG